MSQEYDNTNKGVLFVNERRRNDRDPYFQGSIDIDGTEFWLSGWKNESRDGKKYIKLSIGDEKESRGSRSNGRSRDDRDDDRSRGSVRRDDRRDDRRSADDEIPF